MKKNASERRTKKRQVKTQRQRMCVINMPRQVFFIFPIFNHHRKAKKKHRTGKERKKNKPRTLFPPAYLHVFCGKKNDGRKVNEMFYGSDAFFFFVFSFNFPMLVRKQGTFVALSRSQCSTKSKVAILFVKKRNFNEQKKEKKRTVVTLFEFFSERCVRCFLFSCVCVFVHISCYFIRGWIYNFLFPS